MGTKSRTLPPLLSLLAILVACDNTSVSTGPGADPSGKRTISAALRATCPSFVAPSARAVQDSFGVTIALDTAEPVDIEIYDTTGGKISRIQSSIPLSTIRTRQDSGSKKIIIGWNGDDSTGTAVPSGHYFVFLTAIDSLSGKTIYSDSLCLGWLRGSD
jgi:hypothetical protein